MRACAVNRTVVSLHRLRGISLRLTADALSQGYLRLTFFPRFRLFSEIDCVDPRLTGRVLRGIVAGSDNQGWFLQEGVKNHAT
jgi:hypothetical protein